MPQVNRRNLRLPDDLSVTILRLPNGLTSNALRGMLHAEIYVLLGDTSSPTGAPTGYGAYVGQSDVLRAKTERAGVSLHTWSTKLGRLRPTTVVLVRRTTRPISQQTRLLVEAALARSISVNFTILNWRTAAPKAARLATRRERLWALHTSTQLADLIYGRILAPHTPAASGGSTREQLVRLVLTHGRPMCVDDLLRAAAAAGITIPGATPEQRSRRDVTTRECRDLKPRLHRTHIKGHCVVYPATMKLSAARRDYIRSHPTRCRAPRGERHAL